MTTPVGQLISKLFCEYCPNPAELIKSILADWISLFKFGFGFNVCVGLITSEIGWCGVMICCAYATVFVAIPNNTIITRILVETLIFNYFPYPIKAIIIDEAIQLVNKNVERIIAIAYITLFLSELRYNSSLCVFFGGKYIVFENNIITDNSATVAASNVFNVFNVIVLIY